MITMFGPSPTRKTQAFGRNNCFEKLHVSKSFLQSKIIVTCWRKCIVFLLIIEYKLYCNGSVVPGTALT